MESIRKATFNRRNLMKFLGKSMALGAVTLFSGAALSQSMFHYIPAAMPEDCEFGRTKAEDRSIVVTTDQLQNFSDLQWNLAEIYNEQTGQVDQEAVDGWEKAHETFDGWSDYFDYLRIEGPAHVIQGKATRFKANLFEVASQVKFHTIEDGFVGDDKSDIDANSYKWVTFDQWHGPAAVWATNSSLCSATGVWVQKAPSIDFRYNGGLSVTIKYTVDTYSKAVLNNRPIHLKIRQAGNNLGDFTIPAGKKSGTIQIDDFYFGNDVPVVASFSDGTFVASDSIFRTRQESAQTSGNCQQACPDSLGLYQGQCKAMSAVCN